MGKVRVDRAGIEDHVVAERRSGHESAGLLITMPGADPDRLASLVRRVLRGVPGGVTVYPTTFGSYAHLRDGSTWARAVDEISASVSGEQLPHGVEVRIVPPRRAARSWWSVLREGQRPRPTALMGFSLSPAPEGRDDAPADRPRGGWYVARPVTQRLAEHAGTWVSASGEEGEVFDGQRRITLAPGDATSVIDLMAHGLSSCFDVWFPGSTSGDGGRDVAFDHWGQVAYVQAGTQLDNAALAREMGDVLRHHAEHLDVGAVRPGLVGRTRNFGYADALWLENRHLWATRVQQPNAIQVLTSAHLELARDLSSWTVEEVAEDRWLVSATDLGPWFDHAGDEDEQNVPPDVMEAAVRDFGDMLLLPAPHG